MGESTFEFDIVAQFFFIWAILSSVYLTIFVDIKPDLAIKGLAMAVMLTAGVFAGMRFGLLRVSNSITRIGNIFTYGLVVAILAILIQYPALALFPGTSFTVSFMFYLVVAVAEEAFFRGFLTSWFYKSIEIPYKNLTTMTIVSVVFMSYHLAVYGGNNNALIAVFLSSLILTGAFIFTRKLGVSIIAHVLLNYIASGGGITASIMLINSLLGG